MTPRQGESGAGRITIRVIAVFERDLHVVLPSTDTNLFQTRALDSLSFVTLLAALEGEFGVRIPVEELDLEHFSSIDAIAQFIGSCPGALDVSCRADR